jgi:hypothetical protein
MIKYRRKRSSKVLAYNPWNFNAEPGDLMVDHSGNLFRLEENPSPIIRAGGELRPRRIKPKKTNMKAKIINKEIYWVRKL